MRRAADFRTIARSALYGRWSTAVIAGLIAALLGITKFDGPKISLTHTYRGVHLNLEMLGIPIFSFDGNWVMALVDFIVKNALFVILVILVVGVILMIFASIVNVGYSKFNLNLIDSRNKPEIGTLFSYFPHWKTAFAANLLRGLYVFLGFLLFFVPGIIALYSYAMTPYILAEEPELPARDALLLSKQMMSGNRFRLFCLHFSFYGWSLLCALTMGIGNLWLTPYIQASTAAFYREVSGTEHRNASVIDSAI